MIDKIIELNFEDLEVKVVASMLQDGKTKDLIHKALRLSETTPLRFGQALFNEAYKTDPDTMREIVGTSKDFFYNVDDKKSLRSFLMYCCN